MKLLVPFICHTSLTCWLNYTINWEINCEHFVFEYMEATPGASNSESGSNEMRTHRSMTY